MNWYKIYKWVQAQNNKFPNALNFGVYGYWLDPDGKAEVVQEQQHEAKAEEISKRNTKAELGSDSKLVGKFFDSPEEYYNKSAEKKLIDSPHHYAQNNPQGVYDQLYGTELINQGYARITLEPPEKPRTLSVQAVKLKPKQSEVLIETLEKMQYLFNDTINFILDHKNGSFKKPIPPNDFEALENLEKALKKI